MSNELDQKRAFAKELLKGSNPFEAAKSIFGEDIQTALVKARDWHSDPIVLAEKNRLTESGEHTEQVTKEEYLMKLYKEVEELKNRPEVKLGIMRLIAEVSGFLVKAENASTTNNVIQNNIMVVKDNGDDAEWRKKIAMQQRRLLDASQN